ncbi:hypothetical protein SDC9_141551 [bioreactor metagenome]|uniref:Uncharacterized protein n=1 Tax=bioreactor metagenome TaxID=1076179 RepID=A0A645DYL2_9ZZZZ
MSMDDIIRLSCILNASFSSQIKCSRRVMSFSVARLQASATAAVSISLRAFSVSFSSLVDIYGMRSVRSLPFTRNPSARSCVKALRKGVRLTPSDSESCSSRSGNPDLSSPRNILFFRAKYAASARFAVVCVIIGRFPPLRAASKEPDTKPRQSFLMKRPYQRPPAMFYMCGYPLLLLC